MKCIVNAPLGLPIIGYNLLSLANAPQDCQCQCLNHGLLPIAPLGFSKYSTAVLNAVFKMRGGGGQGG